MDCPTCQFGADVRRELPWLSVACDRCGPFRITTPAAEMIGAYGATVRREVSSRLSRASNGRRSRLHVDLELLGALLTGGAV